MTQEALETILNNSEFNECINEAAPYRVKIIKDIAPQMKEVQDEFLKIMTEADYKGISSTLELLKRDKKDESAGAEYANWKKKVMNLFRAVLKTIHPNENQVPSVSALYTAGSLLEYIDRTDLITGNPNYDADNPLKFKKFEVANPFFANDDAKARMKQIFQDADEVQGEMCAAADMIKIDIFEKLPASVKFDKKDNRNGLKQNNFCALVKHKAMGMVKDKDTYTKYISNQVNNINDNIDREDVMRGKTRQM